MDSNTVSTSIPNCIRNRGNVIKKEVTFNKQSKLRKLIRQHALVSLQRECSFFVSSHLNHSLSSSAASLYLSGLVASWLLPFCTGRQSQCLYRNPCHRILNTLPIFHIRPEIFDFLVEMTHFSQSFELLRDKILQNAKKIIQIFHECGRSTS